MSWTSALYPLFIEPSPRVMRTEGLKKKIVPNGTVW